MSNEGQEANAEGAIEVAIDDETDVVDGRTATSRYSERDIVYYHAKINRHHTSAGKLREGKHLGG
jgi:hypothetical protein